MALGITEEMQIKITDLRRRLVLKGFDPTWEETANAVMQNGGIERYEALLAEDAYNLIKAWASWRASKNTPLVTTVNVG